MVGELSGVVAAELDGVLAEFRRTARVVEFRPARIPLVSTVTGRPATTGELSEPGYWVRHISSPVRFRDTVGVVMEVPRVKDAVDVMRWYCRNCGQVVWEKQFVCTDLGTQVKAVVEEFAGDEEKRTCKACGTLAESKYQEGEIVQPPRFPE